MSYIDEIALDRRLAILLQLYFAADYTASLQFLRDQVERTGYVSSLDQMATEVQWLTEQGLVETLKHGAHRITERGLDVALGRSTNPGVRRPRPGDTKPQ